MAWDEAQYVIDEVLSESSTGIPPRNLTDFSLVPGDGKIRIKCIPPDDTIIDNQLICTVAGVKIVRKVGSPPNRWEDGELILDVKRGESVDTYDENVTNGIIYYYGFYPYSDHGVYNYNQVNVKVARPYSTFFWAFDQNFADKNPSTTISYPNGFANVGFNKMHTNEGTGDVTAGDWGDFLEYTLRNFPYMVDKNGIVDYPLDPSDYTKKKDGTDSDYNNLDYNGGSFAWLNKIYILEEYASDKMSRRVQFTNYPSTGFTPMSFYDFNNKELEGVWLPMGYMDAGGRTLIAGTTPVASKTTDQEWSLIKSFSSRAVFLGGPIIHLLRDLEYMLFKSTDIQLTAGHGRCNAGSQSQVVIQNQVVPNGLVSGWKGTSDKKTMNKYFHSQLLGSYQQWIRDPYTLLINQYLKMSDNYTYDLTGSKLIDTKVKYENNGEWVYPDSLYYIMNNPRLGSEPNDIGSGSTSTGLCDGLRSLSSGIRVGMRFGSTRLNLLPGPAALALNNEPSDTDSSFGAGVILLPPVDYAPPVL